MRKNYKEGFTFLEAIITVVIIGVIALMGIPALLDQLKDFQVKTDISKVQQAVKEARSSAITRSSICKVDFSQANVNHGDEGGLIQVKNNSGTVLSEIYLSRNVLYDSSSSTIENDILSFDFKGQPITSTGVPADFTQSNNTVTISYYKGSTPVASKSFRVIPVTGFIDN